MTENNILHEVVENRNDRRILVVGDIHGQIEALEEALSYARFTPEDGDFLIMLGDLIDRGYGSKETLDFAIELVESGHGIVLRGNHEQMALDAYASNNFKHWFDNGGEVTHNQIQGSANYINFMKSLPFVCQIGSILFVHAGFKPNISLDNQDPNDMIWIREEYIYGNVFPDQIIFTGHTPVQCFTDNDPQPVCITNKIFIDTGAAYGKRGGFVTVCDMMFDNIWSAKCITK